MKKELEELTEEIRKLRKEVRELREAGPRIVYPPQPVYVPFYPQPYQPYTPWWHYGTVTVTPCTSATWTIGNNAGDYASTTVTALPANAQLSLT
jgi:hypothetical protein